MRTKNIILLVVGIILIAGIYSFAKSQKETVPESPLVLEKVFEFKISKDKLVSAPETLKVTVGDEVSIIVTTDEADELHLHGYDLSLDLVNGVSGELSFMANITGKFGLELHHNELELGELEVFPK